MKEKLYKTLGDAECRELHAKHQSLWDMLDLSEGRKNPQLRGRVGEGICKEFVRKFLPSGFKVNNGLVFDQSGSKMSPQCDAIIYRDVPLWESTDVVVVEKKQVVAILEVKCYIEQTHIFGELIKGTKARDPDTMLASDFKQKKSFLPTQAKYILFAFELWSSSPNREVLRRLQEICDSYAIVVRKEPKVEQKGGKEAESHNFNASVSELIEWLRTLG